MPKVSVVVPIYNVEPYVRKCIDSLIHQTLKDIEIILIDDGSTDECGRICDEYKKTDNRIRVIHKSNEGLSAARNDGLEAATATYIMFVDGDDWVEPEFCELPYTYAEKNKTDICLFDFNRIYPDERMVPAESIVESGVMNEAEALHYVVCVWDAAWLAIYHRKLFKNLRYPNGRLFEDTGTTHRLIHEADNIGILNRMLYNYRVYRDGSITTDLKTRTHPDRQEMHLRKMKDLWEWGYIALAQKEALSILIQHGCREETKVIIDSVVETGKAAFRFKEKIMLSINCISPALFDLICKVTRKRL